MNNKQFKLNFEKKENNFKNALQSGKFIILFEIDSPKSDCNLSTVISRYNDFLSTVNSIRNFDTGLAITDKRPISANYNIVDFASGLLNKNDKNNHLLFLSGRNSTQSEMKETINACHTSGLHNIVPVSGDVYSTETLKDIASINFTESVSALEEISRNKEVFQQFHAGCVVNPFKYSQLSIYSQYLKLVRKINYGADYIITQAGWDMYKYQELRWYLEKRGIFIPAIARLILLKPEDIEEIVAGKRLGIFLSPDFLKILKKESKFGLTQFMAAQWRRLQFQIAGLRWFGYSGVVISGFETGSDVKTAISKIESAFSEFTNFKDWKNSYLNYLSRSEMIPYPYRYYIYENLFEEAYSDVAKSKVATIEECTFAEKAKFELKKGILSLARIMKNFNENNIHKFLISGCNGKCDNCCLTKKFMVCAKSCPKKMYHGPCGETKNDLTCIVSEKECIYSKVFRFAAWKKNLAHMEDIGLSDS